MAGTVTVACKLPHGLWLELTEPVEHPEATPGSEKRTITMHRRTGKRVRINGNAVAVGQAPRHPIVGGFALTHGVDADFWAAWLKQNTLNSLVTAGLLFAHEKPEHAQKRAGEHAKLRSGLEPLDPKNLPKSLTVNPHVTIEGGAPAAA